MCVTMALTASATLSRVYIGVQAPSWFIKQPSFSCCNSYNRVPWLKFEPSRLVVCYSKKKMSFTDRILDYIEGGPKLRKWYGAGDELPKDGAAPTEEDETAGISESQKSRLFDPTLLSSFMALMPDELRDAVLVTNGDSEIGQMVILSLILKRTRVKTIVRDKQAALEAFGSYVEPVDGVAKDDLWGKKAMKGVRAIICPSNEGFLSKIGIIKGIEHIVLLSQLVAYKGSSGIQSLVNSKAKRLAEKDEEIVKATGIPYTIINIGSLRDIPGGELGFNFQQGSAAKGTISKEDAASICVASLDVIPHEGLVFEVVNGEEKVEDWKERLSSLIKESA